ncbi:MAG: glycosyltransferase family 2 protein [Candidatus Micrarchaeales archaeon]|nr:glycosyltransferase family 2 protein [Candidatus Micrarchaeales archaeon]
MYKGEIVNVLMPVYNEERTLVEVVKRVLAQKVVDKLVIVDDHSIDRSAELIRVLAKKDRRIEVLSNPKNMGKGFSVREALDHVKKGIVIIQDADKEYYPEDYPKMLAALRDDNVVYGTRMITKNPGHHYRAAKVANAVITALFNALYKQRITDVNTCYKIFRKEMLDGIKLKENRFLIEPEISIALAKKGYRITEVKIRYAGRTYAEGKKIKASDGIAQAFYIVRKRFTG